MCRSDEAEDASLLILILSTFDDDAIAEIGLVDEGRGLVASPRDDGSNRDGKLALRDLESYEDLEINSN